MRAFVVAPLAVALGLVAGCADLLGFKTFGEEASSGDDGGAPAPGGPEAGAEGGGVVAPCTAVCGPGQTCENGACVCDPATCAGCCSGATCSTSWPGCGAHGGACTACDDRSDRCDASGGCACGTHAACGAGQRCASGGCVCDATSCPNGTCCGAACVVTSNDGANCGACGRSCLGATCSGGQCAPTTLATKGTTAWSMTLGNGTIYWLAHDGMYSCPVAGCGASPSGPLGAPHVFAQDDSVQFYDDGIQQLLFATTDDDGNGGANLDVFHLDGTNGQRFEGATPGGYVVAGTGVYWFAGNEVSHRPEGNGAIQVIMSGMPSAYSLASDVNNVYVADSQQVYACPKATVQCGANPVVLVHTGAQGLLATTPDAQFFYVASPIAVYRCPYRGCADPNNPPIWMGAQGLINGIVADANAVYWTDTENGRVMKCPHDTLCNAPVTIASGLSQPWSIAVDDQYVYWTLAGSTTAAVQRAPK